MTRSRALRSLAAAALATGLLAAAQAQAATVPGETTFFLRQEGCGAAQEAGRLSVEQGTDTSDGCGVIGGVPADEVFWQADGTTVFPRDYTTADGVPLVLDASRDVEGVFSTQSWTGTPGVGQIVVELTLTGTRIGTNGRPQSVVLGEGTFETLVTPGTATRYSVPFSFDVPETLQGVELRSLTLSTEVHGANLNAQAQSLEGNSFLDVPTLVAETVEETPAEAGS